jgi:hypothetical protein
MLYLEDLKYMKLYKKKFFLPIEKSDKRHGSAILLLTPDYNGSLAMMNNEFGVNRNRSYEAYYVEKDIMYTVQHESRNLMHDYEPTVLNEAAYTDTTDVKFWDSNLEGGEVTDYYCRLGDKLIFFNEMYDEEVYNEASNYNTKYKKLLYNDRMRNNKQVFVIYDRVKSDNPWIKKTFIRYDKYKRFNTYIDLHYYNQAYLNNNNFVITKSTDMYYEFIRRFINDKRIDNAGYTKKTVFVPIDGWHKKENTELYDFRKNLNPISVFFKKIRTSPLDLKSFGDVEFVFFGKKGYFRFNPYKFEVTKDRVRFATLIKSLENNENIVDDEPDNSPDGITTEIINKLENNSGIVIHSLTGESKVVSPKKIDTSASAKTNTEKEKSAEKEALKGELVKKINNAAKNSVDEEETLNKMESDEEVKKLIAELQDDADNGPKISAARATRISQAQDNFMNSKIHNKSVKDMVNTSNKPVELPEKSLPIKSINEEWKHLKSINFEKEYDLDADIIKILNSLSINKTYPVAILDVDVVDTSTSEDSIVTYTVKCEDYSGKRFTLKFDIPKFRDNRFMRLRGNEKIFSIEMPLIPISKTDEDTVQIVSFYNKIFIETYYTSSGKSNPYTDRLIKALSKYTGKDVQVTFGDNTRISQKYELPIDYIDLSKIYSKIKANGYTVYFNQDEIRALPNVDLKKGLPVMVGVDGNIIYFTGENSLTFSQFLATYLMTTEFAKVYEAQSAGKKSTYSRASILNTDIPVIVILAHDLGLTKAMDLAGIKYDISEKRSKNMNDDTIRLSDGYIHYDQTYSSMMLMNGLKDCGLEAYSIKELNAKMTWVEILENFGGRIKSDGLDNFKDLMYDPVTIEVSRDYNLPTTYHEALIYASNLLVDNKHTIHKDLSTNRYRTNEVIAAQFYRVISDSYKDYALQNKHGRNVSMSMKQSAVIDMILAQNTTSDLSIFQPLNEIETKNTISTKGVTGMNSERAYKIDKRGYDDSMVNIIAQSTGFASTVGLNRQTTINPQIIGGRGYFKQTGIDNMSVTNTMGMTEALSPFMLSSDDPFRNDMTFVQTSKHTTPIEYATPLLVTTGADAAMPYLTSDMFAHKAKKKGKVAEITDKYMVVEYHDGTTEFVNLAEQTMKNSDGGFYITLQLKTDLKVGQSVKEDTILAYDKKSFSNSIGLGQVSYNMGCLTKVAILTTEDGYEDSGVCSEWLSETMSSDIVVMKDLSLSPMTNVLYLAKKGQIVQEGEPVLIFQNAFDEDDANILIKNLNNEDGDVTEIGRNTIKSKVTGIISDIKIYRTCEIEELSESLKKIVLANEREIKSIKKIADQASNESHFDSTEKLPQVGKLKNVDGILIEIYMKYHDKLSVGDKLSSNANKAVLMSVFPDDEAPYTDFRPNEHIDMCNSCSALDGRMITSIIKIGALNKLMIELQRSVCDIMGVKWKDLHEIKTDIEKKK